MAVKQPHRAQVATPHPFDLAAIEKGDFVGPEIIEQAFGVDRLTVKSKERYDLRLLHVREWAETSLRRDGRPMTVKTEKDGLRFMVDNAASRYSNARERSLWRQLGRVHRRAVEVDVDNLTDDEKRAHERTVTVGAARIAGAVKAVRKLALKPARRTTPSLRTGTD